MPNNSIEVSESAGVRSLYFSAEWVQGAMRIARPNSLELAYTREMMAGLLLRDAGMVKSDEPFTRLLCQGMVLADAFYYTENGARVWVSPVDVKVERDEKGRITKATDNEGREVVHAGMTKMSKSKNNGIDPQLMVERYGADTVRLFMMFASPADLTLEWQESGVEGAQRFLRRDRKSVV